MPLRWTTHRSTIHCPPCRFRVILDSFRVGGSGRADPEWSGEL